MDAVVNPFTGIPAPGLPDAGLERNEKLVLYGDDGVQSAQAWLLLRARGYRGARLLKGGFAAWQERVVYPVPAADPTPEQKAEQERRVAVALTLAGTVLYHDAHETYTSCA